MNILIFGSGAVGSVLGGLLARMGHSVSLIGRSWHLDVIRKQGLTITGLWGEYRIRTFYLYTSVEEIPTEKRHFDLILLTVKSFDTETAVNQLIPLISPETMVISFQNGLGNIEALLKKIRPEQCLIGRIITGCELSPGAVKVTVSADDLLIGALPGIHTVRSPDSAVRLFRLSKIPARATDKIVSEIWLKVVYNCALNGLCSVRGIPYGKILESPKGPETLRHVVAECFEVAHREGIVLDPGTADAYFDHLVKQLIPVTAAHFPSMLRDLQRGKRTEIEALNGAICHLGQKLGVLTPENQRITDLIRQKTPQDSLKS